MKEGGKTYRVLLYLTDGHFLCMLARRSAKKYNPHTNRHETFWSPTIAEMHGLIDSALISIRSSPEYIAYLVIPDLQGTTVLNSDYAPVVMAARNLLIFALYATANHTSSTIQARLEAVHGFLENVNSHECSDCDELIQEKAKADSSVALDKTAWKYFTEFKDSGADIPSNIFYLNDAIQSYENKCADQKLRYKLDSNFHYRNKSTWGYDQ